MPAGKIGKYWFDMGYILMVCMNKQEKEVGTFIREGGTIFDIISVLCRGHVY